ncbi:efflux RND transporter permease subunit [Acidovorax sp. sic0104]|uniref:efflux RND transporter permease subunit n=1 Tax=Acidovorax sp. sic0104 TaxID=2854784 RepID=UPI001C44DBA5|nr:efflux RND transporter permease subunit [Acidovorax sp. sic0104]MBV7543690.1 efflux RND transporter permease subunit [Acidovorax sp. sic0104]
MKRFNLSEWAVTHRPMVLFLIILTLIVGSISFSRLGRLEDPNFDVPQMTAIVVWPGATAQDVQDQVLNRIERRLQELDHFEYVRSFSRQGYGAITLWMKGGSSKAELDNAWYQARKKIGDMRQELPEGVRGPFFNDEYNDRYSVLYALSAPDLSMAELLAITEDVKRRFQSVPGAGKVDVLGKQAERVYVELSTRRLASLGIAPTAVFEALARQNLVTPAGSADATHDRVQVRVDGGLKSAADVAKVTLEVGGQLLRLADIATVRTGYEDPPSFSIRHNGVPVLAIGVTMQQNGNVLDFGKALEQRLAQIKQEIPAGIEIQQYADQPRVVEESVWEFERSFLEALAIVLAVSFLFLGWRTGIVVAASVPLVLALVAAVMYAAGWNLDRISLGALIIALGLLVDDAIIAVEMMVVKLEEGWDRLHAATYAYTSTAFPMLTGTLVTAAGFMPVGFAKSIAGQYAGGIFWVVGTALILSWLVAVIFTPYLGVLLLPKNLASRHSQGAHHDPYDRAVYRRLRSIVDWAVHRRAWVLAITVLVFAMAGAGMLAVQQQFFPTASRPELLVDLRLREGASFAATSAQVKLLETRLAKDPDIEFFTAYTGGGTPRFYLSIDPELPNPGFAQFVIKTAGTEQRERVRARLRDLFDKDEAFPDVRARVQRLEFGPPVGFPVQFRVIGPDKAQVREIAYRVRDTVRQSPLVRDTQLDWNEQVRSVQVHVDQDKARLLGLSSADIQSLVQTTLDGAPVTQIRRGEELVDVVVRATPEERRSIGQLGDLQVFTRSGVSVPLSQLARIEPSFEEPVLWRRNRDMVLSVRSDVVDGVQGPDAAAKIRPSLKPIIDSLPAGYRIEDGGAIEESDKANVALFAVFPAMFAVMLTLLMIQLQSFSRLFMVFMTAPLALVGVVPALLLFNAPFGFVALLGVIALSGMIMRNSIILVDQIDQDIARGIAPWAAIVDATVRRSRPVVLTAAAAVLAMIPLTHSVFWGPMAIAIMGGLVVATGLTLVFVPALYAAWFRIPRDTPAQARAEATPALAARLADGEHHA